MKKEEKEKIMPQVMNFLALLGKQVNNNPELLRIVHTEIIDVMALGSGKISINNEKLIGTVSVKMAVGILADARKKLTISLGNSEQEPTVIIEDFQKGEFVENQKKKTIKREGTRTITYIQRKDGISECQVDSFSKKEIMDIKADDDNERVNFVDREDIKSELTSYFDESLNNILYLSEVKTKKGLAVNSRFINACVEEQKERTVVAPTTTGYSLLAVEKDTPTSKDTLYYKYEQKENEELLPLSLVPGSKELKEICEFGFKESTIFAPMNPSQENPDKLFDVLNDKKKKVKQTN
jgi:hypothetical protein